MVGLGGHVLEAFAKSFFVTVCSEVGDKTFFIAAILAIKSSRMAVFLGASGALLAMTALSVLLGWGGSNLISKEYTHYAAVALFFFFGLKSISDFFTAEPEDEFAEAEEELAAADKAASKSSKASKAKASGLLSPALIKAFSLTFLAEWGDRSQIATIGLAASGNPYGVAAGGFIAHSMCTGAAVLGGRHLSQHLNERLIHLCGGVLFIVFGIHGLLTGPE